MFTLLFLPYVSQTGTNNFVNRNVITNIKGKTDDPDAFSTYLPFIPDNPIILSQYIVHCVRFRNVVPPPHLYFSLVLKQYKL